MPKVHSLRPLAVCLAACLATTSLNAATINSTTRDASGNPIAGVVLTLRDAAGNQVAQQTSDVKGAATFTNVPAGSYVLQSTGTIAPLVRQAIDVTDGPPMAVSVLVSSNVRIAPLNVTATRLKEAQIALSPKIGTTVYTIDQQLITEYGKGDNTPMNEVLLQLPGVAQDSKASGSIHVRDEHANVQFRINGVTLPEGISGFG
jgi:hypothetical protein